MSITRASIKNLTNLELRDALKERGLQAGPIVG
jgi:hypothetical protein